MRMRVCIYIQMQAKNDQYKALSTRMHSTDPDTDENAVWVVEQDPVEHRTMTNRDGSRRLYYIDNPIIFHQLACL